MIMPVTDLEVATLRAQLAGRMDERKRLFQQLDWASEGLAYVRLVDAGFFEAVDRRFGKRVTVNDVIAYVADVRSRFDAAAEAVDPRAGEQLILEMLGHGSTDDLDDKVAFRTKSFLLTAMIADEHLDDGALDEFMTQVRKIADRLLS
jgi:hypothetical protein